ncbi:MAG: group II intron maturase-specific domain-containing protein, partial [Daejeonella sp.]
MREQTKRNHPIGTNERIAKLESVIRGWVNYFSIAKAKSQML